MTFQAPADRPKTFKESMIEQLKTQTENKERHIGEKSSEPSEKNAVEVEGKRVKGPSRFEEATPKRTSNWDQPAKSSIAATPLRDISTLSGWDRSVRGQKLLQTPATVRDLTTPATVRSYFGDDKPKEQRQATSQREQSETQEVKSEVEIDPRNRYISDEELNKLLPLEGYEIVKPPADYKPAKLTRDFLTSKKAPIQGLQSVGTDASGRQLVVAEGAGEDLPAMREDDLQLFGLLLESDKKLTSLEQRQRKILTLLLKIKNGTPAIRKAAMKVLSERCRDFGAEVVFSQLFQLLQSPTLDEWERHLMVKVLNRMMFRLEELCRPHVTQILKTISSMLLNEDNYVRSEGRELVANLAKAVGLPTMLTALRPDIDSKDEFMRNIVARCFAVVAGTLGVKQLVPFLGAAVKSKKSWEARHTGVKVVQQIAILLGSGVLPYLQDLVNIVEPLLADENPRVKVMACLAIVSLAEASAPFGIDSFGAVLSRLWVGLAGSQSRLMAAYLQAVSSIIPLMPEKYASEYITLVMNVVMVQFENPEEEMKRTLLKVIKQCLDNQEIKPSFVIEKMLSRFWDSFWIRKLTIDRLIVQQLTEATLSLAKKIGSMLVLPRLVLLLKEDHEPMRRAAIDTIVQSMKTCGVSEIELSFDERLVDAASFAFHQQSTDDSNFMLERFASVVSLLELRAKPFLPAIVTSIAVRIKTKTPRIRQQAADLITQLAVILAQCDEERLLVTLGQMLYENLGEEYPEVLGSIIGAIKAVFVVLGPARMSPGIPDLLPTLTPILQNRHDKVQEQLVDLIGKIADKAADQVNAKEWVRICFDLLDLLKAERKKIRRATINTFGYIAKAIGPQDVILTLINNLKVQERQMRICTTVAIAIVAEACGPFTVIPALMNEYRVPSNNIQNGILKSFSFMFEYIGEMAKDYVYAVTPMLEDALLDRDLVHRQTAATILKHLALGVAGFGCEDVLIHIFNYVIANLFETSPHVVNAVTEAFEAMRVSVGPGYLLMYVLQGLFHPAKRVRESYWRLYNLLYIGAQDSLVPFYPALPVSSDGNYQLAETTLYNL